jgi:uncharacterized glyoxalase superfamily protein PhnB
MKKVYPLVITDKLKECAAFYSTYFGFEAVFAQDWYIHLAHPASGEELAFMAPNVSNQPQELHASFGGSGMVYGFEVEDATQEYNRLAAMEDAPIITGLKDETWGERHFMLRDPAGVYVDVVQRIDA